MKQFRLIVAVILFLVCCMVGIGMATETVETFSYRSHTGFTRLVFPAEVPLDYSLKVEASGDEKYLVLASPSPVLFAGFSAVTVEDGLVRRLDMSEPEGKKNIRIALGPQYRAYRSFTVRQPDRLVVEVLSAPESKGTGGPVVVLDVGHGGPDPGTVIPSGGKEKDLCLDLAARVKKLLEKEGMKVVMTRNADYVVPDMERASIAYQSRGGLFLSIHAASRAVGQEAVRTFVHDWSVTEAWVNGSAVKAETKPYLWGVQQIPHVYQSVVLASSISAAFLDADDRKQEGGRMPAANLIPSPLLAALGMPAVLVEVVDLPEKSSGLASEKYRQKAAERLARGMRAAVKRDADSGGPN